MVIVDVEATGLDHAKCSLLSIGAVYFEDPTIQFYQECRANDKALFVPESMELCGFTYEQAMDPKKQTQTQLVENFMKWLAPLPNKNFAGKNVHFDYYWIEREVVTNLPGYVVNPGVIELHTVYYMKLVELGMEVPVKPNGYNDLGFKKLIKFVGLGDIVITHNALEDAVLEAECLSRLLYGKSLFDRYKGYKVTI